MCLMGITVIASLNDLKSDPASRTFGLSTRTRKERALSLQEGPYLLGISASFVMTNPSRVRNNRELIWSTIYTFLHFFRVTIFEKTPILSLFENYDEHFQTTAPTNQLN